MDKVIVKGGKKISGEVVISGSKNSVLSILAATLLTDEECVIKNVPRLKDIDTMCEILRSLNSETLQEDGCIVVKPKKRVKSKAPYELVRKMRASICVLGPLLSKHKKARVSFPGGCIIGPRPIDLHLKGLRELGADIKIEHGYVEAETPSGGLTGAKIYMGGLFGSSVLGTANVMMAAALAKGKTVIEEAACEPEISDLAEFLIKMGADIKGHGTSIIKINGKDKLSGTEHEIIPDRIEAGTYLIAGILTAGRITVKNCYPCHMKALIEIIKQTGVKIKEGSDYIEALPYTGRLNAVDITTAPYPGFPTDMQAQIMSLTAVSEGISVITEKVYPKRFLHAGELNRMGADIKLDANFAVVKGVNHLSGAPVMASDLRASAALILAGLVAEGETTISRIYHLDRGYENIEKKLSCLGANIKRLK